MFPSFYKKINFFNIIKTNCVIDFFHKHIFRTEESRESHIDLSKTSGLYFIVKNKCQSDIQIAANAKASRKIQGASTTIKISKDFAIIGSDFLHNEMTIRESLKIFSMLHSGIDLSASALKVLMCSQLQDKRPKEIHQDDKMILLMSAGLICPYGTWLVTNYEFYIKKAFSAFDNLVKERVEKNGLVLILIQDHKDLPKNFSTPYDIVYL